MRKLFLVHLVLFLFSAVAAQYQVRFIVQHPSPGNDSIFIAGYFNKWNPGDPLYKLTPIDARHHSIMIRLPAGHHEFKFTRGTWTTVESTSAGLDVTNRVVEIKKDTTIPVVVEGWLDKLTDISKLPDSVQWNVANLRSFYYLEKNLDSSYKYAQLANSLMSKNYSKTNEATMLRILGRVMQRQGNHQRALEFFLRELDIVKALHDTISISFCLLDIGNLFMGIKDYQQAKNYYNQVLTSYNAYAYGHSAPNLAMVRLGKIYYNTHQLATARYFAQKAYDLSVTALDRTSQSESLTLLGNILSSEGNYGSAIHLYKQAIDERLLFNNASVVAENYQYIAKAFFNNHQIDSAFHYAIQAFSMVQELKNPFNIADAASLLVTLYKSNHQTDSAFKYLEMEVAAKDSLFNQDKTRQVQSVLFDEQLHEQEIKAKEEQYQNKVKIYALLAGLGVLIFIAVIFYRNYRSKLKANQLLQNQKEAIQATLTELKATQAQLIQSEKMASLGNLTAGIAHEIQNPLNFMNNFAEVNVELIEELQQELDKENISEAKKVADDIKGNELKIWEHGKRAGSIIKGMLQHSRMSTGQKELTNINNLVDEYLRLSYHGLRAKDKTFNATLETHFDSSIQQINIVPQDVGRVLLNLYNNAFYALHEKKQQLNGSFQPVISITTKRLDHAIEIVIRDNGTGIPLKVLDKIFQPFFTTKPSEKGTGLGLSLSYDIITKGHGGALKVNTEEGKFTEFVIQLPV